MAAKDIVLGELESMTLPVDPAKIKNVATISANGDEVVGSIIAEVNCKTGPRFPAPTRRRLCGSIV
jgi:hypothetical protein